MASNQRKEEIRVEWSTNYQNAIQQIEQVKKSVGDNATELENLNRVQQQLEDNFKGFEKTLDFVAKQTADNEYANQKLTEAIEKLEKQIVSVDKEVVQLNKNLENLSKNNVDKSIDKSGKSIDKASKSTNELTKSTSELTSATKSSTAELAENAGIWEVIDESTMGFGSRIRDVLGLQNGFGQALRGNTDAFNKMSTASKVATVSINATKLAMKALLTITGVGLLIVGLQTITENWETITNTIKSATDSAYAHSQAITDAQVKMREQLDLDDLKINRLKQQGKSEQELIKIQLDNAKARLITYQTEMKTLQDMGVKSLTMGESISLYFKNFGDEFKLNTLRFKQNFEDMLNSIISGYESFYNQIKNSPLLTELGLTDGKDAKFKRVDFGVGSEMVAVNDAITARTDAYLKNTDKYKELAKNVATADSVLADYENRLSDLINKNGNKTDKKTDEAIQKAKEQLKAWQEVMRNLANDTAILESTDVFEKRLKELAKAQDDFITERQLKYDELEKTHTKGSEAYIKSKKIIDDYYGANLKNLADEKRAITDNTKEFENLTKRLGDGTMNAEKMKKEIDSFLEGVENSEMREKWAELLGLKQIEDTISFMEAYKDEMKEFTIDDSASFNDNANKLQAIKDFNLSLLDEERATALARADELELSEENRLKIIEKFKKQQNEIESNYNEASKELNVKRATQISEYADVASSGLSSLGSLMSENFEANKAFAVADSVINTFTAINGTLASLSSTNPYLAIATSIAIGLQGFANVVSILKTTPENASAQSAPAMASLEGAKNQPNVSFQQSGESQLAQTINNQNNDPIKAYVVAKDVTSQQEKDNIKKNNSSL